MPAPENPRLLAAVAYAEAGLRVLPIVAPTDEGIGAGKRPHQLGWQHATNTEADLRTWFKQRPDSNVGLICGAVSGVVCIDIDPRNGGMTWYDGHRERLTGALVERTGSGGLHLWFRHPGGYIASRTGKCGLADGVELKADGGHQVVVAPSIHPCGDPYVVEGDFTELRDFGAPLPEWIATAVAAPAVRLSRADQERYADRDGDIAQVRTVLADIQGAVEGEGGDAHTFRVCCLGRDYALSPGVFWELLLAWNDRCSPPWAIDDLHIKVANAYRYSKSATPGEASPATHFEPVAIPAPTPSGALPAVAPTPAPLPPEAVAEQAAELTPWEDALVRTDRGMPKPCTANAELVLRRHPDLRGILAWNEFSLMVELCCQPPWGGSGPYPREWTDTDDTRLEVWMSRATGITVEASKIARAVDVQARTRPYHPVRQYLRSLRWDGVPRLDTWVISTFGAPDTAYARAVSSKTLIAAVARIERPGCKVDTMLILEGAQGTLKSTAFRVLCEDLWFCDATVDIGTKDAAMVVRGKWIVEMAELESVRRAEITEFKAFLSRQSDRQRDAYARRVEERPRQNIFVGSTNEEHYLKDETGGRRFWPLRCPLRANLSQLALLRSDLWAEAFHRYQQNEPWWLDVETEKLAAAEQSERLHGDDWETLIRTFLDGNPHDRASRLDRVTGAEIFAGALQGHAAHYDRNAQYRISNIMRAMRWTRTRFRREDGAPNGYVRPLSEQKAGDDF